MNNKFDFSEMEEAIQDAGNTQSEAHDSKILENNYTALNTLNHNVEELRKELSTLVPSLNSAAKVVNEASKTTITDETRQQIKKIGEEICNKLTNKLESKGSNIIEQMARQEQRIAIPYITFYCMALSIILFSCFFACIVFANYTIFHLSLLWKVIGLFAVLLIFIITLIVLVCNKLNIFK